MINTERRKELKAKRRARARRKIEGSMERPRISVFRSPRHMFVQVIDDVSQKTLVSVGTQSKANANKRATIEVCSALGTELAKKCLEQKIEKVVLDRNGCAYHGRIKALAEAARAGGLKF